MSQNSVIWLLALTTRTAGADLTWTPLGDAKHPNCAARSCVVREGQTSFEINMVVEGKGRLEYLDKLTIKNGATGRTQEFDTSGVSAVENHQPFRVYAVNLRSPGVTDLALFAYHAAAAGPSYYYYLFDAKKGEFTATEETVPKLVIDPKTRALKTEVQGTPFVIKENQLVEK